MLTVIITQLCSCCTSCVHVLSIVEELASWIFAGREEFAQWHSRRRRLLCSGRLPLLLLLLLLGLSLLFLLTVDRCNQLGSSLLILIIILIAVISIIPEIAITISREMRTPRFSADGAKLS